jgi:phosphonate transport system substrate-binding protein
MSDESYQKEAKGKLDRLRVIYETFSLSRHILSAGPDLPPKLVVRIKEILLTMDQSEEGRKVLQAFEKTTRFDELPDEVMARLLKLEKLVDAELAVK